MTTTSKVVICAFLVFVLPLIVINDIILRKHINFLYKLNETRANMELEVIKYNDYVTEYNRSIELYNSKVEESNKKLLKAEQ